MGQNIQEKVINSSKKFTVKSFALKNRESGAWPNSESAIWALQARAPENDFGEAFIHGPKTPAGIARIKQANTTHGKYTK